VVLPGGLEGYQARIEDAADVAVLHSGDEPNRAVVAQLWPALVADELALASRQLFEGRVEPLALGPWPPDDPFGIRSLFAGFFWGLAHGLVLALSLVLAHGLVLALSLVLAHGLVLALSLVLVIALGLFLGVFLGIALVVSISVVSHLRVRPGLGHLVSVGFSACAGVVYS